MIKCLPQKASLSLALEGCRRLDRLSLEFPSQRFAPLNLSVCSAFDPERRRGDDVPH